MFQPADPVCSNGMQYMNDCWAQCFGVFNTTECDYRLQNAINFTVTDDDYSDVDVTEDDISNFIANISVSLCCPPDVSFYRKTSGLPSIWLSEATCSEDHTLSVRCGRGKTGVVTRVCQASGLWEPENAANCSDIGILELGGHIGAISPDNAWQILSMLNSLMAVDTRSLGVTDIQRKSTCVILEIYLRNG